MLARTLVAIALLAAARGSDPGGSRCASCRCEKPCQKIGRLVCEEKEVEVTCWGCQCENFALPGPSRPGCKHCDDVCQFCDERAQADAKENPVCSQPHKFVWRDWIPNPNAKVFTKKKLMKKVVKHKVPSYKWVVEDLCADCAPAPTTAPPGATPANPAGTILEPRTATFAPPSAGSAGAVARP